MNTLIPYIIFIIFLLLASTIVITMESELKSLILASIIIIVGYIISALTKYKIEGIITDERIEYNSLKAKATAFDAIILTIAIYTFANIILKEMDKEPIYTRIPAESHIGLLALLILAFYAIAYIIYSHKSGGI
ncbi:MAG: hypothetical protein GSR86_02320 [Desulfurococcales archaeon]|nr:hypothetical protein [Desulfurococcales archaeon]